MQHQSGIQALVTLLRLTINANITSTATKETVAYNLSLPCYQFQQAWSYEDSDKVLTHAKFSKHKNDDDENTWQIEGINDILRRLDEIRLVQLFMKHLNFMDTEMFAEGKIMPSYKAYLKLLGMAIPSGIGKLNRSNLGKQDTLFHSLLI